MKRRCTVARAAGLTGAGLAIFAVWPRPALRGRTRQVVRELRRRARDAEGRADGWLYRMGAGGPDPHVSDDILAERVRAALGPVVHGLDLPHVHVLVEHRVALLHGDVGTPADRATIEAAVQRVVGIEGVESHLHVGLLPSDTRPSEGAQPSADLTTLVRAAQRHGGGEATALVAVKAVLGTLAAMLPDAERVRLASHLPRDVGGLLAPPRRMGTLRYVHTVPQMASAVVATGLVAPYHGTYVLETILPELRRMVPDDATDVALLLPPDIRALWDEEPVTAGAGGSR